MKDRGDANHILEILIVRTKARKFFVCLGRTRRDNTVTVWNFLLLCSLNLVYEIGLRSRTRCSMPR